jgi:pyridoxamine 5'-phosphate oxidase
MNISDIRKDYSQRSFSETDAHPDAIQQFEQWWAEALRSEITEVNAMTLATASATGLPAARIVLLKGVDKQGFVFFTNFKSFKGNQLEENPRACLVFFWKELERQIRITGLVQTIATEESNAYYHSRPLASQIGAWASPQSQVIINREWLENEENSYQKKFNQPIIPRPMHWGGYRVLPTIIEFWQGRPNRLHDRLQYTLQENGLWQIERLAP